MNARAILQAQGWRGDGHTLHATSDGIGLKKRLLVSRKDGTGGLGASQYANDQWWLSALQEQLSGLDTSSGKVVQKVTNGKLDRLNDQAGKSELYKFFIYGGILQGTVDLLPNDPPEQVKGQQTQILDLAASSTMNANPSESESSTSNSDNVPDKKESKAERRARKAARRARREQKRVRREARKMSGSGSGTASESSTTANSVASIRKETKEQRRARREAKRKLKEDKKRRKSRA